MFKREGFRQGSDRNPEAIVHVESEPRIVSPSTPSIEMLPLPAEQRPVIGEPKTLLRKRQVKQLLSMTERILEGGSEISLASFSESCVDLTEVAGRHGIEIADQVSCAAGWNPLSSSGRHRFWHIHCTLTPKLHAGALKVELVPEGARVNMARRVRHRCMNFSQFQGGRSSHAQEPCAAANCL